LILATNKGLKYGKCLKNDPANMKKVKTMILENHFNNASVEAVQMWDVKLTLGCRMLKLFNSNQFLL